MVGLGDLRGGEEMLRTDAGAVETAVVICTCLYCTS